MGAPTDLKKRVKRLIDLAEAQGWTVILTRGGNHYRFLAPDGGVTSAPLTPSDYRGVKNLGSKLRRMGLIVSKL